MHIYLTESFWFVDSAEIEDYRIVQAIYFYSFIYVILFTYVANNRLRLFYNYYMGVREELAISGKKRAYAYYLTLVYT